MTKQICAGLLLAFTPLVLSAQSPDLDQEKALIKSWGLQMDSTGYLRFNASERPSGPEKKTWAPDLSAYQPKASAPHREDSIDPLVVSAKNAK